MLASYISSKVACRLPITHKKITRIVAVLCFSVVLYPTFVRAITLNDALVDAADRGQRQQAITLLKKGKSVDSRGDFDVTPLMRASFRGHTDMVHLLLQVGAYVNASDVGGSTALHLAAMSGYPEIVRMLLDSGAMVDVPDKERATPLMRAVLAGERRVVAILIERGANVSLKNEYGETALLHAVIANLPEVIPIMMASETYNAIPQEHFDEVIALAERRGNEAVLAMLEPAEVTVADSPVLPDKTPVVTPDAEATEGYKSHANTYDTPLPVPKISAFRSYGRGGQTNTKLPSLSLPKKAPEQADEYKVSSYSSVASSSQKSGTQNSQQSLEMPEAVEEVSPDDAQQKEPESSLQGDDSGEKPLEEPLKESIEEPTEPTEEPIEEPIKEPVDNSPKTPLWQKKPLDTPRPALEISGYSTPFSRVVEDVDVLSESGFYQKQRRNQPNASYANEKMRYVRPESKLSMIDESALAEESIPLGSSGKIVYQDEPYTDDAGTGSSGSDRNVENTLSGTMVGKAADQPPSPAVKYNADGQVQKPIIPQARPYQRVGGMPWKTKVVAQSPDSSHKEATPPEAPAPAAVAVVETDPISDSSPKPMEEKASSIEYLLQLGAFSEEPQAMQMWRYLKTENPDILSQMTPQVAKAFLAEQQNVVHRLRVGKFDQKKQAASTCTLLRKRGVECFVVETAGSALYLASTPKNIPEPEIRSSERAVTAPENPQPTAKPYASPFYRGYSPEYRQKHNISPSGEQKRAAIPVPVRSSKTELPWKQAQAFQPSYQPLARRKPMQERSTPDNVNAVEGLPWKTQQGPQLVEEGAPNSNKPLSKVAENLSPEPESSIDRSEQALKQAPLSVPELENLPPMQQSLAAKAAREMEEHMAKSMKAPSQGIAEAIQIRRSDYPIGGRSRLPYNAQTPAPVLDKNVTQGTLLLIDGFSTESQARDYWRRMFRYNKDLSHTTYTLSASNRGSGFALQVESIDRSQAEAQCDIIRRSGYECSLYNSAQVPTVSPSQNAPTPAVQAEPEVPSTQTSSAPQEPEKKDSASGVFLNMGRFGSRSEAEYYLAFLLSDYDHMLGQTSYKISENASLSSVSLLIGPFASSEQASNTCKNLQIYQIRCHLDVYR